MSILALSLPGALLLPAVSTMTAVTVIVAPSAAGVKLVLTKPLALSCAVTVTSLVTPPEVTLTTSPMLTWAEVKATLTSTLPFSSALLMKPSLFASSVIVTVGAAPLLGTPVSMFRGTVVWVVLPAASVSVTWAWPVVPLGMSCVGVTVQVPLGRTVVVSTSPVPGIVTLICAPGSPVPLIVGVASLVMPSPLVPLSEAGSSWAVRTDGGVVSTMALSVPVAPRLPATSLTWAVTVKVLPSPGLVMPGTVTLPLSMSACVSTIGVWAVPLALTSRLSPALAVAGRATETLMLPLSSAWLM